MAELPTLRIVGKGGVGVVQINARDFDPTRHTLADAAGSTPRAEAAEVPPPSPSVSASPTDAPAPPDTTARLYPRRTTLRKGGLP